MSKKDQKNPKKFVSLSERKTPKIVLHVDSCLPEFKSDQMDMAGPWGWDKFDPLQLQEVFQKIFESQKLTWQVLRDNGSHLVQVDALCSKAQKRLGELGQDDCDELFSFRITGRKRIWGIKDGNILWLLWWDPEHEVCPSNKKHT